jgi:6-phosphofructokinase 1
MREDTSVKSVGILVGGGPAPGINGVINAASIHAVNQGLRVLGILDGFQWLMAGDAGHVRELRIEDVSRIPLQGGSILRTSRANPTRKPEHLATVVRTLAELGIDQLITIGGDDTAFSAKRVAEEAGGRVRVVHVPKTIDNDLPLPTGIPTFGFETAREHGSTVVERLLEDTRTTGRWFFVVMMGRAAGHLALGAGKSAGATVILIPEEFPGETIRLDDVVRILEGSIVKRLASGRPDGVAVIAEGLGEHLDPKDLEILESVERDEHGHIRLAEVPLGRVLREAVTRSLAERGVSVRIGDKDVGYELRCGTPTAFDRDYTRDLGFGAMQALLSGQSGVLITRQASRVVPVPFDELIDPMKGRTRVRTVDTSTDAYAAARAMQVRVEGADLEDPKTLARLAEAAHLEPAQVKQRYAPA